MKKEDCDILIVGAGPAGSSAAIAAAEKGLKVLVVERRKTVGIPVRCAEYIPGMLLGEIGLGRGFVVQSVRGMKTFISGKEDKETIAPGFIVNRDILDQCIAEAAEKAGARILLSTPALSREREGILIRTRAGDNISVNAKVVIGADGPHSTVGRWIGSENRNLIPGMQYSVPLNRPMDFTEIYIEKDFFAGYAWVFPKGDRANIGIGMKKRDQRSPSIQAVLKKFLQRLSREGKVKEGSFRTMAGWIPAESPRKIRNGNVILAGDAAGHTHPITGAGVSQAVIGGRMAGKWAAEAVISKDIEALGGYEEEWADLFGETLERACSRRNLMEKNWENFDGIIRKCWVSYKRYYERDN